MQWIILPLLAALAALTAVHHPIPHRPLLSDTTTLYATSAAQLRGRAIPDSVFTMTHLRLLSITGMDCDYIELDERGNDVTRCWTIDAIPPEIGRLKELEELRLPLNAIHLLPVELRELAKLRVLDLTDNASLTDVEAIARLDSLEDLSLCGCGVRRMPSDLSHLRRLKSLCLAGNHIDRSEQRRIRRALPRCRVVF